MARTKSQSRRDLVISLACGCDAARYVTVQAHSCSGECVCSWKMPKSDVVVHRHRIYQFRPRFRHGCSTHLDHFETQNTTEGTSWYIFDFPHWFLVGATCPRPLFIANQRNRVILTQILRMVICYKPNSGGVKSLEQLSIWTGLHLGFGVICACLPVFRVYLPKDASIINATLIGLYTTVTTCFPRLSRKSSRFGNGDSTLPSFVRPNKPAGLMLSSSPELPSTELSDVSLIERLGAAEFHVR